MKYLISSQYVYLVAATVNNLQSSHLPCLKSLKMSPQKKVKKNGRYYIMRQKRAAEFEARYEAATVSTNEEMDFPPPQQVNDMFDDIVPPTNSSVENPTAISVPCAEKDVCDDDLSEAVGELFLSEAEIAYELLREHLEYEHNAETTINLLNELRQWALQNKITLKAFSELLKLLNKVGIENLPLDARTILKTPRTTDVVSMGSAGEFWYDGIARNLINSLLPLKVIPDNIELIVNVDDIPPFVSTGKASKYSV